MSCARGKLLADVVKTRLMNQDPANPLYRGVADCFVRTLRAEGWRGLYKGWVAHPACSGSERPVHARCATALDPIPDVARFLLQVPAHVGAAGAVAAYLLGERILPAPVIAYAGFGSARGASSLQSEPAICCV